MFCAWISYYYRGCQMANFKNFIIPSAFIIWHFTERKSFLFLFFWGCFFFLNHWNTSAWTPGFLFYSFFIYFDARIIPEPFQSWLLCPFFYSCPIILRSLTFLFGTRFFVLVLYFQCPSPGINHFIREIWFLLLEDVFRK